MVSHSDQKGGRREWKVAESFQEIAGVCDARGLTGFQGQKVGVFDF